MLARRCTGKCVAFFSLIVILTFSLLGAANVYAQVAGATLSGTVTDASGSTIPKAQLTITDVATGVTARDAESDSAGFYSVPNLLPATYEIKVTAAGFSTTVQKGVTLTVGAQQQLNFSMQVGQVSQTVEVTAQVESVELTSSALTDDVNPTTVRELPLNGRDWIQLATLQPGIALTRTQASGSSGNANRGSRGYGNQFSGSGHRPYENNFRINGITVNDYANGAPGSVIGGALGVDAIQEFSVLTTDYTAEYGRTTGAIINAITKSGTNEFHGDAYYFMRDEGLDARNFFDPPAIPPFHRNQFGASGGAPIIKDKLFVFGDYESIRQAQSLTFSDTVPSPSARGIGPTGQPQVAVVNGTPLPLTANSDPATHIDKNVLPFLGFYPLPNAGLLSPDAGTWDGASLSAFNENYETARIDYKITSKDSFAGTFYIDRAFFSQPDSLLATLNASATLRNMVSLEETRYIYGSPTFVNTARIGFARSKGEQNLPVKALNPLAADTSLGIGGGADAPTINPVGSGFTVIQGGLGQSSPGSNVINSFQGYDDAFLIRGTHTIKFGVAVEHLEQDSVKSATTPGGRFGFSSYLNFLTNNPSSFLDTIQTSQFGKPVGIRQTAFGAYIADDWKARPNLTVNFGLRYEPG